MLDCLYDFGKRIYVYLLEYVMTYFNYDMIWIYGWKFMSHVYVVVNALITKCMVYMPYTTILVTWE
jgi:hypothetical protein